MSVDGDRVNCGPPKLLQFEENLRKRQPNHAANFTKIVIKVSSLTFGRSSAIDQYLLYHHGPIEVC